MCYNLALELTTAIEDFTYKVHSCTNDDNSGAVTDESSNSCSWYDTNLDKCGQADGASFNAATLCCACGGGYIKDPDPVNGVIPKITASVIVEKRPVFSNSDSDGACAVAKTWKGKPSEINDDTAWQLLSDSSPVDFPALGFKVIETCTNADVGGE